MNLQAQGFLSQKVFMQTSAMYMASVLNYCHMKLISLYQDIILPLKHLEHSPDVCAELKQKNDKIKSSF